MKLYNLILVLALCLGVSLNAQDDFRNAAPKAGPAPKIELGEYERFELDNGLQVIVVENHKLPRVSFQLFVDTPPIQEGEKTGASGLAGQLLGRGTTTKAKAEIDEAVDFIGASLNTSSTGIFAASLTKHKEKVLDLMVDVLYNPAFDEEEFKKVKTQTLSALAQSKDDPNAIASNVSQVIRYGKNHPYGEIETEASIDQITVDDCKAYYETYFKPNISYLVIVGDITPAEGKSIAEKYFGKWERGTLERKMFDQPTAPEKTVVDFVNKREAVQSVVSVTYPVELHINDDDYIATRVLSVAFGGYFGSRLMQNIREDKGYSYGARASLNQDKYIGFFTAGASVRNEVTDSSITEMIYEMNRIRDEKMPAKELTLVKNYMAGSFARSLESAQTIARFALNIIRYQLPADYYDTYLQRLEAVTDADVQAAAQKYIKPGQAHVLVVGDKESVAEKLAKFSANEKVAFFDTYGNPVKEGISIPEGMTAQKVIEGYIDAIGGKDNLAAIKDVKTVMGANLQGMGEMNVTINQTTSKMAMKIEANGMVMQEIKYNGTKGQITSMGQAVPLDEKTESGLKEQAVLFPELQYASADYKIELKGIEQIEQQNAYVIEVISPAGSKQTDFFNMNTFFKVRSVRIEDGPQGSVSITTDFKDYQKVGGVEWPHVQVTSGMMPIPIKMDVKSIDVNEGIEDSVFSIN